MQRHIPTLLITDTERALEAVAEHLGVGFVYPHSDVLLYDETVSLGIDVVRDVIDFTRSKPYVLEYAYVVMLAAHTLTEPAQHALLKTLEEHPAYARIVLCSPTQDALIATMRSRMQIVRHMPTTHSDSRSDDETVTQWHTLSVDVSPGKRLALVSPVVRSRDTALEFVSNLIHSTRSLATKQPSPTSAHRLSLLLETHKRLSGNGHVGLTMEQLALSW